MTANAKSVFSDQSKSYLQPYTATSKFGTKIYLDLATDWDLVGFETAQGPRLHVSGQGWALLMGKCYWRGGAADGAKVFDFPLDIIPDVEGSAYYPVQIHQATGIQNEFMCSSKIVHDGSTGEYKLQIEDTSGRLGTNNFIVLDGIMIPIKTTGE